ncbi:MAG: stage V sporulation protein AE [Ruminococcus sp.]|nr:stage V sporulation protein AE [Ruminococcus sp.]
MQYLYAFLVGGAICLVGQLLIDKTKLTPARILTGYVVTGVILSAVGVYQPLADFAGAGATVPLCGFGHLMAQGVKNAVDSIGAVGILKGGLTAGSAGITAAIVFGLLASLLSKSKEK